MNTTEFMDVIALSFSESGEELVGEQPVMINQNHVLAMTAIQHEKFGELIAIQAVNGAKWVVRARTPTE